MPTSGGFVELSAPSAGEASKSPARATELTAEGRPSGPMSALRIDVADLLAHPGARRELSLTEQLEDLAGSSARVAGPVHLELSLERISEGIVARGLITAPWQAECSLCLNEVSESLEVHVDELFEPTPVDGETYPIEVSPSTSNSSCATPSCSSCRSHRTATPRASPPCPSRTRTTEPPIPAGPCCPSSSSDRPPTRGAHPPWPSRSAGLREPRRTRAVPPTGGLRRRRARSARTVRSPSCRTSCVRTAVGTRADKPSM
jgi:hypothetical protein